MRKLLLLIPVFLILIPGCQHKKKENAANLKEGSATATEDPDAFRATFDLKANEQTLSFDICFLDSFAIEMETESERPAVIYDLAEMNWTDISNGKTVALEDCETWAEKSAQKTERSLQNAPDDSLKRFVRSSLTPNFEFSDTPTGLEIKNEFLSYKLRAPLSLNAKQIDWFFSYDVLNAYRKAILEKNLPPFPQLAVSGELKQRELVPGIMDLVVKTPKGDVNLNVRITVGNLAISDIKSLREFLPK